jgi:site-specific recombinase XerD
MKNNNNKQVAVISGAIGLLSQKMIALDSVNNEGDFEKRKKLLRHVYSKNDALKNELFNDAVIDDMKDRVKHAVKLSDIDIDFELKTFFENCSRSNSEHTKSLYKKNINEFCNFYGRNIVSANHHVAQQYLTSLKNKQYSARTIRVKIASVSSFFTFLSHRYDFINNIFFNLNLPDKIDVNEMCVPEKSDIDILIKSMKKNEQYERALLIEIMRDYGLRSGAFENMRINKSGQFVTITKGREYKRTFNERTLNKIIKIMNVELTSRGAFIFSHIKASTIQRYIVELTKKLYAENKISCAFSCHDLRHYFAINFIEKHKNDSQAILKLKSILHHSSLDMTYNYLRTLNFDFD